jgi:GT2 family glycosyltransferase
MTSRTEGGVSVIPLGRASLTLLIQSLQEQLCNRWELLLPGGSKTATDSRLRHLAMGRGHAFVDEALAVARYDIVVFVTRNVSLEADSIYWILRHIRQADAELFVWDFLQHNSGSSALEAICRSGFSLDYYLSRPDHGGAYAVRREAARLVGWGKGEVDFTLRLLENGASVAHTPVPLHRVEGSPCEPRPVVLQAIQAHLDRRRTGAKATAAFEGDAYAVSWPPAAGRTLIVIPTFNQADLLNNCVKSILETTPDSIRDVVIIDHRSDDPEARRLLSRLSRSMTVVRYDGEFNFSKMNNLAVRRYGGNAETVLFLNNDTFSLEAGWLERLRSLAIRPDVGAVGALLLYGDRKVQHAGVLLGFDGSATHAHALMAAFRHDGSRLPGYDHHLTTLREVSAVTAACMMMRRAVFDEVRGFDEDLRVGFNDTDLCLRIRGLGYRILQDGQTTLEHYESRTRRLLGGVLHPADTQLFKSRYERTIRKGDPFYNPNLRLDVQDHELRPDCRLQEAPRISHPLPLPSASRDRW